MNCLNCLNMCWIIPVRDCVILLSYVFLDFMRNVSRLKNQFMILLKNALRNIFIWKIFVMFRKHFVCYIPLQELEGISIRMLNGWEIGRNGSIKHVMHYVGVMALFLLAHRYNGVIKIFKKLEGELMISFPN